MKVTLLSPITLYKEYINIVEQKGEQIVLKEQFLKEHKFVFWNMILYFKIMKLPIFMLDLDYSKLKVNASVSQIKKYLPSDKKSSTGTGILNLGQLTSNRPALLPPSVQQNRGESSPARKSSLNRLKESMLDKFLGQSNTKKVNQSRLDSTHGAGSDKGDPPGRGTIPESQNTQGDLQINNQKRGGSFAGSVKKGTSSKRSAGGETNQSDADLIRNLEAQAKHANRSILKYFGKHLEEFRKEQTQSRDIILQDQMIQGSHQISDAMQKHIANVTPHSQFKPMFTPAAFPLQADAIIQQSSN